MRSLSAWCVGESSTSCVTTSPTCQIATPRAAFSERRAAALYPQVQVRKNFGGASGKSARSRFSMDMECPRRAASCICTLMSNFLGITLTILPPIDSNEQERAGAPGLRPPPPPPHDGDTGTASRARSYLALRPLTRHPSAVPALLRYGCDALAMDPDLTERTLSTVLDDEDLGHDLEGPRPAAGSATPHAGTPLRRPSVRRHPHGPQPQEPPASEGTSRATRQRESEHQEQRVRAYSERRSSGNEREHLPHRKCRTARRRLLA